MDITSFVLGMKLGKNSGGGTHPDLRYVTFMNGDEVHYVKPVAVGDDCVDVVAKGLVSSPTIESTAQYNYTFAGWDTYNANHVDGGALKAVTENRTVYACYTASIRSYTATFYDEDGTTILATKQVEYGTIPSYTPTKEGYDFVSWTPTPTAVTADVSYTAVWKEQAQFATATWEQIASFITDKTATNYFALGDTRTETITYADGTTEDVKFEIVDTDASNIISNATFALLATHTLSTPISFDKDTTSGTSLYYMFSDLLTYLKDIANRFPTDMQSVMLDVSMPYANGNSKLHVPTIEQLGYIFDDSSAKTFKLGSDGIALEAFVKSKSLACKDANGNSVNWWTATTVRGTSGKSLYATYCDTTGNLNFTTSAKNEYYIRLLFFI